MKGGIKTPSIHRRPNKRHQYVNDFCQNLRKSERRIKELSYQQDEDRKNHERMQVSF
jgi:hypothetical protein